MLLGFRPRLQHFGEEPSGAILNIFVASDYHILRTSIPLTAEAIAVKAQVLKARQLPNLCGKLACGHDRHISTTETAPHFIFRETVTVGIWARRDADGRNALTPPLFIAKKWQDTDVNTRSPPQMLGPSNGGAVGRSSSNTAGLFFRPDEGLFLTQKSGTAKKYRGGGYIRTTNLSSKK